jgi:TPR repeat protein
MQGQPAATSIGFTDLRGLTVDQLTGPPEETARWLQAAARFGVVEGQTALGQILLDGHGIVRDRCAAARWFSIAAEAGHAPAINMLGRCHELGWGVPVDLTRAADCYRRASETGLDWGQYNFANLLLRGRGVPRDRKAALALYRSAAEQGHAKSINMVGRFMEEGWETAHDPQGAADCYRRSAEAGDFRGQYNFASILALSGDITQAETWLQRAMQTATPAFLSLMSVRLANSPEPRLRQIGAIAAARAGRD